MLPPPPLSDELFELIAQRLRVIGQSVRIQLVDRLHEGPAAVHELTDALGGAQQNISQHLAVLHQAGILNRHRDGPRTIYRLVDPNVLPLLSRAQASLNHQIDGLAKLLNPNNNY